MQFTPQIHESVTEAFKSMKLRKSRRFIRLHISDDKKYVILDNESDSMLQQSENFFQNVARLLEPESCCFLICDVQYKTKESSNKTRLVLIQWCPTGIDVMKSIQYLSVLYPLIQNLPGINAAIELKRLSELQPQVIANYLGEDVLEIEGVKV